MGAAAISALSAAGVLQGAGSSRRRGGRLLLDHCLSVGRRERGGRRLRGIAGQQQAEAKASYDDASHGIAV